MRPRIGCVGLGWIGRQRMEAVAASGLVDVTLLWDEDAAALDAALQALGSDAASPPARAAGSFEALLDGDLDGVMIATPSALHAQQTMQALERGLAVFCQKPLARTRAETERVVRLARRQDRLLQVDLSYRFARAFEAVTDVVTNGGVGEPHAIDLTFHNAYGPDKPWYYTRALSGGGCVMDLGIHLVDLLLRICRFATPRVSASRLFVEGVPWRQEQVEDLAFVQLDLASGGVARLACSWRLPAGCDAVIEATVYGPRGGVRVRNVDGSFYDFIAERLDRGGVQVLVSPPDAWGGRAAIDWARQLAEGTHYDSASDRFIAVADVLDEIYDAAASAPRELKIASNASAR